jgi:hypothetical protein
MSATDNKALIVRMRREKDLRRIATRLVQWVIALSVAAIPVTIAAQGAVGTSRIEASVRASQARAAIRRGDEPEAVRLLRISLSLADSPDVRRELALLYERRSERRLAAEQWTLLSANALTAVQRTQAAERASLLRATPSLLRVWVVPRDAARMARVWFDRDVPRFVPVGGAETLVEGGPHRVRVESPGYVAYETMITTGYGEPVTLTVQMHTLASGAANASHADGGDAAATARPKP